MMLRVMKTMELGDDVTEVRRSWALELMVHARQTHFGGYQEGASCRILQLKNRETSISTRTFTMEYVSEQKSG
jgi:hypothetical protein